MSPNKHRNFFYSELQSSIVAEKRKAFRDSFFVSEESYFWWKSLCNLGQICRSFTLVFLSWENRVDKSERKSNREKCFASQSGSNPSHPDSKKKSSFLGKNKRSKKVENSDFWIIYNINILYYLFIIKAFTPVPAFSKLKVLIFKNEIFENFAHEFLTLWRKLRPPSYTADLLLPVLYPISGLDLISQNDYWDLKIISREKNIKSGSTVYKNDLLDVSFYKTFYFSGSPGVKNPKTGQIFNLNLICRFTVFHFQWCKKFDPKCPQICNLTQNPDFFSRNNFLDLTDHLEPFLWKFISPVILKTSNVSKPE